MTQRKPTRRQSPDEFEVLSLTPDRWNDLARLFGPEGAFKGCWCMWWRQTESEHFAGRSGRNRQRLRRLSAEDPPPGLIAYLDGRPVGWCSIGPRDSYPRLQRSGSLKPIDDRSVWSIVCFYVEPGHRQRGVASELLQAALEHARSYEATAVEAYPVDGKPRLVEDHTGFVPMFTRAGFKEVARRAKRRPIMRRELRPRRGSSAR
jgi:GNAT superfamily N-acetyltransferase